MKTKGQDTKKTLYEIAHIDDNGALHRGGLKATIATVGKWIEESLEVDPDTIYVAVPADDDAITIAENNRRMRDGLFHEIEE